MPALDKVGRFLGRAMIGLGAVVLATAAVRSARGLPLLP